MRTNQAEEAFHLDGLTKHFGDFTAVDQVGLSIPVGSFFGLVGPNGAGKTTLLSMAVGLIRPDSGTSAVHGHDLWQAPKEAKAALGVLLEGDMLPRRLTGAELLTYVGLLRGMKSAEVADRSAEVLRALDLVSAADVVVADYSTGMRKKIALAAALLHGPSVLVLDEPFEAVDPVSAATIRSILTGYVARGGTVVFSSHVMALVELLCDRVAVLDAGRVVAHGTLDEVRGGGSLEDAFAHLVGAQPTAETLSWFRF
ncbi:ABC transporter ATP-binding protein [Microlunatus endophyticus]|uniref:ABC transporter ATP-binding protein n=1 Tax=Microlunatus endophyticus TaxID=1716077 RepID=A0A917S8T1_9ACTN|nr:ABC transporter ATP-binding protein [Microlunatus endophyticus]GGL63241.1 ABC transporter ATP-binding protein [Microlunatus endophyticus]